MGLIRSPPARIDDGQGEWGLVLSTEYVQALPLSLDQRSQALLFDDHGTCEFILPGLLIDVPSAPELSESGAEQAEE